MVNTTLSFSFSPLFWAVGVSNWGTLASKILSPLDKSSRHNVANAPKGASRFRSLCRGCRIHSPEALSWNPIAPCFEDVASFK